MTFTLLIIVVLLPLTFIALLGLSARSTIARVLTSLLALGFAFFCVFGFLACFEPSSSPRLPLQLTYGVLGLASLSVPFLLFLKKRPKQASIEG